FAQPVPPAFYTLSLHDALPISLAVLRFGRLGDLESVVFGLEDDLLLLRARLRDEALGVRSRGGLARERERAAEQESDREAHKTRSEEHTSELQSPCNLVCRLLL